MKKIKLPVYYIVMLVALTLLAPTLKRYTMPHVVAEAVQLAVLDMGYETTSTIQPAEELRFYAPESLVVEDILVRQGENVRLGKPLFLIDEDSLTERLAQLDADIERLSRGDDSSRSEQSRVIGIRGELSALSVEISQLKERIAINQALYDQQAISKRELTVLKDELAKLSVDYQNKANELRANPSQPVGSAAEKLVQVQIEALIKRRQALQAIAETREIVSTRAGVIGEINVQGSNQLNRGQLLYKQYALDQGGEIVLTIDAAIAERFAVGDKVYLAANQKMIKSTIYAINQDIANQVYNVIIVIEDPDFTPGSICHIDIQKMMAQKQFLVPTSAVIQEGDQYIVYTVSPKEGVLGTEHVAKRTEVDVVAFGQHYVAIRDGIHDGEYVVRSSDRLVTDNIQVLVDYE